MCRSVCLVCLCVSVCAFGRAVKTKSEKKGKKNEIQNLVVCLSSINHRMFYIYTNIYITAELTPASVWQSHRLATNARGTEQCCLYYIEFITICYVQRLAYVKRGRFRIKMNNFSREDFFYLLSIASPAPFLSPYLSLSYPCACIFSNIFSSTS